MDSDDLSDFELIASVSKRARFINTNNFDEYVSDNAIQTLAKNADTHVDFTTVTTSDYPSALNVAIRALKEKYEYGAYQIEDNLIFYGLRKLWKIIEESNLTEAISMIDGVRKYAVVPELKQRVLYKIDGDSKKPFHVGRDTYAFCNTISEKLDVSNANICMISMLISFSESPTVLNNYRSINETYLFNIKDNIYNSSEQFFNVLVKYLSSYGNYIYNLYCKEMLQSDKNIRQLDEMYEILHFAKNRGVFIGDIIDYKTIKVTRVDNTVVVNNTKKEQIPEFETLEPVFEQPIETTIADKPITQKVVIEKPSEPEPVDMQEPLVIEKPIVIEKPVETDIKKVIKHLVKLIFNRLHLSKK